MTGLTEQEILSRHTQSLREARDACLWLAQNADPDKAAPRGRHYNNLRKAIRELDGTCRQMSHWRSDARWVKLGVLYAKALRTAHKLQIHQNWLGFKNFAELFVRGLVEMDRLATGKTGVAGAVLPKNPSSWLILPDEVPHRSLWTPHGRMMN